MEAAAADGESTQATPAAALTRCEAVAVARLDEAQSPVAGRRFTPA